MNDIFEGLSAPFPPEKVSWRLGKIARQNAEGRDTPNGMALAYLDARDVMGRLDDVCGPAGWQNRYSHANGKTVCDIGILCDGEWIWKADGAGDSDIEAEKGALSDAFKRAAVRWGIGRYLYDIPSPWVNTDKFKQIEKYEYEKLEDLLKAHTTTIEWGDPSDRANLKAMANGIRSMLQTADDVRRYREANAGVLQQMRVKAREHINDILDKIEENAANQAG